MSPRKISPTSAVLLFETELLRVCDAVDEFDLLFDPERVPFMAAVPGPSIMLSSINGRFTDQLEP